MRNTDTELRTMILDGAAELFEAKGIRFTMDDLAKSLGMSKKTLYTVFRSKRSIMKETLDRFFDESLRVQEEIFRDPSLTIEEKLRRGISSVPERYAKYDLRQLYVLKERYPSVYRHWQHRRDGYWNGIGSLIEEGIRQGVLRPVPVPILKTMFQSTIEQFFQNDVLVQNDISYLDALREVADVLLEGIAR